MRNVETDQKPASAAVIAFGKERAAAIEMAFGEIDHSGEAELEGGARAARSQHPVGGKEITADHRESGLDPGEVDGIPADRPDPVKTPGIEQPIPCPERVGGRHPQLVAEIAGEA